MDQIASTSNYFQVAAFDDQIADSPGVSSVSIAPSARQTRIAAAIQRSKTEYRPQHALTEREVRHYIVGVHSAADPVLVALR
jgi:2-succinyl-5-enolpyruvyl-6-hydroxy-3-cyclohexene-1-carboxylate synthase